LAVFGEILSGVLGGSRIMSEIPSWFNHTDQPVGNGHLHIAIDIAHFGEPAQFKARIDAMVTLLKATPLVPGVREILLPGERAWRTQQEQERHGIPVPSNVAADLQALATRLGVATPDALANATA
jgi:LDH2 family malate/lactate/ureidoglycolate dehydrogenase